ncbi:type I-E CRISPR-associated endonuclease Cas1e [Corynebacterium pilosum]|nr:type I-E CRISPR-associated endonuclease Cas1e [Corynebacterium pilosum]
MADKPSASPIDRLALTRMEKRLSFLYVERAVLNRDNNALTITDQRGVAHVPSTQIAVLLLGPGTKITYAAMSLLGDSGTSVVWVGSKGIRFYAAGRPPAKTARLAEAQARIWSNQRTRLACARKMYQMRFPNEDVSKLNMAQLRGREGTRMKRAYAEAARRTGVDWSGRRYDPNDFSSGDPINQALTSASAALYGVAHAVIAGLGLIPSLGIIHSGTDRSFVYDLADLYKAEIAIPCAFEVVASGEMEISSSVRKRLRQLIVDKHIMQRMVRDLQTLLEVSESDLYSDVDLILWSELEVIAAGVNWGADQH